MAATNDLIPDFEDFERYHSGEMPPAEQRSLEGRMLDEPLIAEAYEGFLAWREKHSDVAGMRADLHNRLHERVARGRKSVLPLWAYASAASVLLAFFAYWTFFLHDSQVVKQKQATIVGRSEPAKQGQEPVRAREKLADAPQPVTLQPSGTPSLTRPKPADNVAHGEAVASESVQDPEFFLKPDALTPEAVAGAEIRRDQIVVPQQDSGLAQTTHAQPVPEPAHALTAPGTSQAVGKSIAAKSQAAPSNPSLVSQKAADTVPENPGEMLSEVVVAGWSTYRKESAISQLVEPDRPAPTPAQGWPAYRAYLEKNTGSASTTGQVVVTFVVSSTGALSGFVTSGPEELHKEAIRIISKGPAWAPARTKGMPVTSLAEIQLQFRRSQ